VATGVSALAQTPAYAKNAFASAAKGVGAATTSALSQAPAFAYDVSQNAATLSAATLLTQAGANAGANLAGKVAQAFTPAPKPPPSSQNSNYSKDFEEYMNQQQRLQSPNPAYYAYTPPLGRNEVFLG
jgi:hypothetical protein